MTFVMRLFVDDDHEEEEEEFDDDEVDEEEHCCLFNQPQYALKCFLLFP